MKQMLANNVWPLFISVLVTTLFAVIAQTQRVISMLQAVGGNVSLGKRFAMSVYDAQHLGSVFGLFILIAFIIAMTCATLINRKMPALGALLYCVAGAVAIVVMLMSMKTVFFDVQIIAGARDALGLALQMLAGALGGYVFYVLRERKITSRN